ncbi:hypothetical protein D9M72_509580 [compost metagenome]
MASHRVHGENEQTVRPLLAVPADPFRMFGPGKAEDFFIEVGIRRAPVREYGNPGWFVEVDGFHRRDQPGSVQDSGTVYHHDLHRRLREGGG